MNIALVNQLALLCERMGLDVWEVIDAAATKPFGFMRFTPGPGVGGHCIPVDPYYLSWRAREFDFVDRFVELAGDINLAMPRHVVDLVAEALNERGKALQGRPRRRHRRRVQAERPRCPQLAGGRSHPRPRGTRRDGASPRPARPDVPRRGGREPRRARARRGPRPADAAVVVTAHAAIDWDAVYGARASSSTPSTARRAARCGRARCSASGRLERRLSTNARAGLEARAARTGARRDTATRRPVAMVVHAYYDEDPRVRREAESLVAAGRPVDVFGLRRDGDAATGELAGVTVHRLDVRRHQGAGLLTYLAEYLAFLARASWALDRAHRRRRYALVQVHTPPDFLAFAAMPLRLVGVPLAPRPPRGDAGVLPSALPARVEPGGPRGSSDCRSGSRSRLAARGRHGQQAMRDRLVETVGVAPAKVSVVANSPSLARFDASALQPAAPSPRTGRSASSMPAP